MFADMILIPLDKMFIYWWFSNSAICCFEFTDTLAGAFTKHAQILYL
jgi:hypothetical protein